MFGLGTGEILLIFLVVLLLFGAKRIPEVARGLGRGIREFKKAASDISDEINGDLEEEKPEEGKDEKAG